MALSKLELQQTTPDDFSARMEAAYLFGSYAFTAIGLCWAVVFVIMGWWWVVALDLAIVAIGIGVYSLIKQGRLAYGLLAAQVGLTLIVITMCLLLDVPTPEAPRVSHLYLLVVAALGYFNYQREKTTSQALIIGLCLLAFIVFSSSPFTSPFVVSMPDTLRTVGTWINAALATALLGAAIHAMHVEFILNDKFSRSLIAALWNEEFSLVYQPQVDLSRNTIGAEALLRWDSPQRGQVSPAEFIPQAEKFGLMVSIGGWVLERGCQTLAEWEKSPKLRHLTLSINVSTSQLMHDDFETLVRDTLEKTGANPKRLILEITESVLVTDMDLAIAKLDALREMGITISLDDFGTGYSSLSYLRRLPIQQLKVDRSFVHDAGHSSRSTSLVKNVIQIGADLGHNVLAEGIETSEQHALMAKFGCMQFQGFLYAKPMQLDDFVQYIEHHAQDATRARQA